MLKLRFKHNDGTDYLDWEKKKLDEVCDVIGGGTPSTEHKEYWNGDIQWFTPSEIGKTKYVSNSERTISDLGFSKSSARKLPKGTILLTSRATLGEMSIATKECTTNQGFQSLVPTKISGEYLYYLQPIIKKYCVIKACGSTFNEISNGELKKCVIPCPCPEEQQKIADFLSAVDEVIAQTDAEVHNLEQQKKAAMQKIFSQEVRFKREDGTEFPDWEEKELDDFCDIITKQTGFDYTKTIKASLLTAKDKDTLPYLQTKNFSGISFDYHTDYYIPISIARNFEKIVLDRKCLLFSIVGASVGNIALFPNVIKCFLSGAICVAKPTDEEQTAYLYYYMCSGKGQSQIRNATKGSGQATITIEDIRLFTILTPNPEEQKKIADFLSAFDDAITYAKQELDKWKQLKKGLLQQMFV